MSPKDIIDKDDFFDNKLENLRNMNKEQRNEILLLELNKILWELHTPSEYIKSLLQEELNNETWVIEKNPYQKRKIFYSPNEHRYLQSYCCSNSEIVICEIWTSYLKARDRFVREVVKLPKTK